MSTKFIKAFILIIIIPVFIINFTLNNLYKKILLEQYTQGIKEFSQESAMDIHEEIKKISLGAAFVSHDEEIIKLLKKWRHEEEEVNKFNLSKEIDSKLNNIFNFTDSVDSIIFFFREKDFYYHKAPLLVNEENIRNEKWYEEALKNRDKVINLDIFNINGQKRNSNYISVCISPDPVRKDNELEMIYFKYKTTIFKPIYSKYKYRKEGEVIIADEDGNKIISSQGNIGAKVNIKEILKSKEEFFTETTEENKFYIIKDKIKNTDWYIINIIDYEVLTRDVRKLFGLFIATFFLIIVFYMIFSLIFFKEIVRPIKNLIHTMKNIDNFNYSIGIEENGVMEIEELKESYNKMLRRIDRLIRERDEKEKERSKEEIKALQAQINPHFLYNTLNSIRLMSMITKVDSIKNMTDAFMKLLLGTFRSTNKYVTLHEELENLKNYIYIMKVRYGDNIEVKYNMEESLKDLYLIKLILQPIVENSILHGLNDMNRKGIICIKAYSEDKNLIIEVIDNGKGIDENQLKKLFTKENKDGFNKIGVINVDKRVKLNFGEKYGLTIKSKKNHYTIVKYKLPIILESEGEKYE
jgi:two-component system sensor histidine kinase YesM